jgi:ubiquinone/menaquinone biosynthesis C-methylase UbiE
MKAIITATGAKPAPGAPTRRYCALAWRRHPSPHNESHTMSQDPVELTRGLLEEAAVLREGFLDVLGESTSSPVPTVAQRAMNSPFVATVYERVWRPTAFYLASGITHRAEQYRAASALQLSTAQRLLDVACGPGNFTGPLAAQLPDGSLAVGFDISAPMLTRAVLDNSGPQTCYVRGDAHKLPFGDETFDAVCCFGALYLMPEPFRVAREMMRVLKPGGRIAILTSYAREAAPIRHALTAGARAIGLTMFDQTAFVDLFSSGGLVDVEQQMQRALQFVAATKPG